MWRTTENKVRGIRWTPFSYLEELDYTGDLGLALLLYTNSQIQETTQHLNFFLAKQAGLNISGEKDWSYGTDHHQQSNSG